VTVSTEALAPSRLRRGASRTAAKIFLDAAFSVLLFMGTIVGVIALATLIWTIFDNGWERLVADPAAFLTNYVSRLPARAGIRAALIGSAYLMVLTTLFCFPVGVGAAIYLEEFAPRNRVTNFVEANIANLAGVPSVVYGLLGLGIFARFLRMGPSLLAGALTLAVMSLPVIIVAAREAIRAVPDGIRLGAYALGATKWPPGPAGGHAGDAHRHHPRPVEGDRRDGPAAGHRPAHRHLQPPQRPPRPSVRPAPADLRLDQPAPAGLCRGRRGG
jgi:hypothetical protein